MESLAKQQSYWVAYIETLPGYPCCSFTASPLIPWKAKRQMEQGNEEEPCYTELSTHYLFFDQIKVGHSKAGSKVVLFVCLFLFFCSKTPPAKFNYLLFFWRTGEFPVICYHGWNFRRKVTRCGLFCLHLEWLGVRRLWATDPSVKLLIEEKNTLIYK